MTVEEIKKRVEANRENIIQFLRDIVAIPSMDGQLKDVGDCIQAKMRNLGFDEARFDKMGNTVGRIGNGPKVIVFDSHIDTVGVGDPAEWDWDPFVGKVENGALYARGACDEKGSTPGMVYGLAIARDLGLLDGYTAYYFGNMEEWCDGIAPNAFVEADPQVKPDFVIIGEPTKMQVYRGHKGRIELKITAHGQSAHAASHYLGDNAVYKMMSIITQIRELDRRMRFGMGYHPVQGYPSIAVTDVEARTASLNAVPDQFTIYLDRRITLSEPRDEVINTIKGLIPDYLQDEIHVEELFYDAPSYTGFVFPVSKFYPPWLSGRRSSADPGRAVHDRGALGREPGAGHLGFLHQRHLLGRQGGHPVHWLWSWRREDRPHAPRERAPGRSGGLHRVLCLAAEDAG